MKRVNPGDCKKILIYGGMFDPPHIAHITLPLAAMKSLGADAIAYIPAAVSPLKKGTSSTPAHDRLAMLEIALRDQPRAVILTDELDRAQNAQPSYTVDTLEALQKKWGDNVKLFLLIGTDQMRQFHQWKNPQRIVQLAQPVVMVRPPENENSVLASLPDDAQRDTWRSRLLTGLEQIDVSSTEIRKRLASGQSIRGLVCPEIEVYIFEHRLYRHD